MITYIYVHKTALAIYKHCSVSWDKKKQDFIKRPFKNNDLFVIGKEDYKELKDCLAKTFEEIEKIKEEGVQVDGEHYDVQWCI